MKTASELHDRGCSHREALTLVELLVVIAVIAILASLLLPVLNRVKEKAHTVAWISNLKQLQLGWATYLHDSMDWMPPYMERVVGVARRAIPL